MDVLQDIKPAYSAPMHNKYEQMTQPPPESVKD
jgi:hypothetical protein